MKPFELAAALRDQTGKDRCRRLRRQGQVPAVLYGSGKAPLSLSLEHEEVRRHLDQEAFYSHILTLKLEGGPEKVVLKDLHRHPYKPQILHLDFLRIDEHERLTMRVPIHFINEDKCAGVKQAGGIVSHLMTEIEVVCLPKDLPEYIAVDLAPVTIGTTLHLSDLDLPEGVQAAALAHGGDAAQAVVSVHLPRVVEQPEGEAAEAVAGAGGEQTPS